MKDKDFYKWLAGFFDGEGCIQVPHGKSAPRPRFTIVNTHLETMEIISKRLQVRLRRRKFNYDRRPLYCITLSDSKAIKSISKMIPYLITKRKQAELVSKLGKGKCGEELSKGELNKRMIIREKIHKLNGGKKYVR